MRLRAVLGTALVALVIATVPASSAVSARPDREPVPSTTADPGRAFDPTRPQGPAQRSERATAALTAARGLLTPSPHRGGRGRGGGAPEDKHASLVLRDLAVGAEALAADEKVLARALLARPTDSLTGPTSGVRYDGAHTTTDCDVEVGDPRAVCLHWVTDQADKNAPPPGWVPVTQEVVAEVWQRLVGDLGYKPPRRDLGDPKAGPDGRLDVYLAELGRTKGLYGYCAPEWTGGRTAPVYCVLDNDFAEFDGDALDLLKVTAAHELFHAVQMAYTVDADAWVAEGTATWVEDEVFGEVDDNLQYLDIGPLAHPGRPLDLVPDPYVHGWRDYDWRYGSWIWWRFLSEYFGHGTVRDTAVVRDVWDNLAKGQSSGTATRNAVASRGQSFGRAFADFGAVNRHAKQWYADGPSYRQAPVAQRFSLSRRQRGTGWRSRVVDHLATQHITVRPGKLSGRWRARIELDAPNLVRGSQATVTVERRSGDRVRRAVRLDRYGGARLTVPFGRREVARVALSLTNASLRMRGCGDPDSPYSCAGWPRDDGLAFRYRVTAVR